jgi:Ser/Thr protein kinase RdoA (MazF antagonist)
MAQLHQHAAHFRLPEGADLFTADNVLYNLPNAFETAEAAFMPAHRLEVFRQGLQATQAVLNAVFAAGGTPRVIHTDLHEGNLKWFRGRLSVFDFDDCAFGQPAQDVATAIRSLSTEDDFPAHRAALERGYMQVAPWPVQTQRELEGLVVARGLLLANDVLLTLNPELREVIPGFLTKLEAQVERFLETA